MHLDASSIVMVSEHLVHVVTRGGTTRVKGNDVHHLHARLKRVVEQARSIDDVLAATPPAHVATVRSYLSALWDARVLSEAPPRLRSAHATDSMLRPLGAGVQRLAAQDDMGRIRISLAGPIEGDLDTTRCCFVTLEQLGQLLVESDLSRHGRTICIVVDDTHDAPRPEELERRAQIARWLLLNDSGASREGQRLQVYRIEGDGDLRHVASVEQIGSAELRQILMNLSVLHYVDVDQAPLVVLGLTSGASHAVACGLTYDSVASSLLRHFLVTATTDGVGTGPRLVAHRGNPGTALVRFNRAAVAGAGFGNASIASSWVELQLQLLEQRTNDGTDEELGVAWQTGDLLHHLSVDPSVAYLQRVVRLRRPALNAAIAQTANGLWHCRCGEIATTSFIQVKAIADLLAGVVWREFYPDIPSSAAGCRVASSYADFADRSQLQRLLAAAIECRNTRSRLPTVCVRAIRKWETSAWAGYIDEEVVT